MEFLGKYMELLGQYNGFIGKYRFHISSLLKKDGGGANVRDPSGGHCLGGTKPLPISKPPSGQDNGKTY